MKAYILGSSAISSQNTFDSEEYLEDWVPAEGTYMKAVEPSYAGLLNPRMLRRMSKIVKMGCSSAMKALKTAEVELPEAIIVGTGLGCTRDTEVFLNELIDNHEQTLSPTAFIQSTHNTVAGQIALLLQCDAHNFTYSNRGHSFENALEDGMLLLEEGHQNVLVGGADEVTPTVQNILAGIGCMSSSLEGNEKPVLGEGASFFVLSKEAKADNTPFVADLSYFNAATPETIAQQAVDFLQKNGLTPEAIDVVVTGQNPGKSNAYYAVLEESFTQQPIVGFKTISGEYFSASAFGLQLSAAMLMHQKVYSQTVLRARNTDAIKHVLIYNHYNNQNHSFILVSC
tara:strand:- start:2081 stop:3106 length:1026 start_codon:yes stop_codon:yes gene_type:complete